MDRGISGDCKLSTKERLSFLLALVLLLSILAGCGGEEGEAAQGSGQESSRAQDSTQGQESFFDILVDTRELFRDGTEEKPGSCAGMQFVDGEPIQFWTKRYMDEAGEFSIDVQLYREDGTAETLFEGLDNGYNGEWFLDAEGYYYILTGDGVIKLDAEGEELWNRRDSSNYISDICQLPDGRLILLVRQGEVYKLAELDAGSGRITVLEGLLQKRLELFIAAGGEGKLLLLEGDGIYEFDLRDGGKTQRLGFADTTYSRPARVRDFALSGEGTREALELTDVAANRTVITFRSGESLESDGNKSQWLRRQVINFNRQSDRYYVVMETIDEDMDWTDYRSQTNLQLGTGNGADVIQGMAVDEAYSLMEKGVFEDLSPYMEQSNMKREDYFPIALDIWSRGEAIYGIDMALTVIGGYTADAINLGSEETPELEELLDIMLSVEEPMVFHKGNRSPEGILRYFLAGSENLWGMLDWKKDSCSFDNKLFEKMLRVAQKYAESGMGERAEFMTPWICLDYYGYEDMNQLRLQGRVPIGFYFDDGNHATVFDSEILAINAASDNKEGAWEFISYLLGDAAQSQMRYNDFQMPVNRKAYYVIAEREMEVGSLEIIDGTGHNKGAPLTEERIQDFARVLESVHVCPIQIEPILNIIREETAYYFSGEKDFEETCKVIENRVGVYMSERK